LSLTPIYLESDDHATDLIRLLLIGLSVLTLLQFVMSEHLTAERTKLAGPYAGNPKGATAHPTAEHLLETFQQLTLTIIRERCHIRRHLIPLSLL
jgi:transposase